MATGSIAAPRPVSPASNSLINNQSQPVTLVVQNAVVTKPGDTSYTFEVATDSAFATRVQTKDGDRRGERRHDERAARSAAGVQGLLLARAGAGAGTTGVFGSDLSGSPSVAAIVINAPSRLGR